MLFRSNQRTYVIKAYCGIHLRSRNRTRGGIEVSLENHRADIAARVKEETADRQARAKAWSESQVRQAEERNQRYRERITLERATEWTWERTVEQHGFFKDDTRVVYRTVPTNGIDCGLRYEIAVETDSITGTKYLNVCGSSKMQPNQAKAVSEMMAAATLEAAA